MPGRFYIKYEQETPATSAWCRERYEEALERGDAASAQDYLSLYELWVQREQAAKKGE